MLLGVWYTLGERPANWELVPSTHSSPHDASTASHANCSGSEPNVNHPTPSGLPALSSYDIISMHMPSHTDHSHWDAILLYVLR